MANGQKTARVKNGNGNGKKNGNVVKREPFNLAISGEELAGKGFEQMGTKDLALPFLKVLGQLSPQVTQGDANFIPSARAGMIYNSVTQSLYDGTKGIEVIPCFYKLEYLEWPDRKEGVSAPVNTYPADSDILTKTTRDEQNMDRLPNGNYVQETASHFVVRVEDGQPKETALISMKATQRKKSKMWNSMMKSLREKSKDGKGYYEPAMFTQRYLLTTVLEKNAKGTWYGWKIGHVGPVQNQMLLDGAMGFYDHCLKGDVKVKHEEERQIKPVTPF